MDGEQFRQWWRDYQAKFPSVLGWMNALSQEQQREQFAVWLEVLNATSMADALAVNRLMATGAVTPVGTFDHEREKTAQVVRSEADALRRRRDEYHRHDDGPRCRCQLCYDTGYVEVFRPAFVAALAAIQDWATILGKRWRGGRNTQMQPCACEAAARLKWKDGQPRARFEPDRYCRCPLGRQRDVAVWREAAEWYDAKRSQWHEERMAAHEWRPDSDEFL